MSLRGSALRRGVYALLSGLVRRLARHHRTIPRLPRRRKRSELGSAGRQMPPHAAASAWRRRAGAQAEGGLVGPSAEARTSVARGPGLALRSHNRDRRRKRAYRQRGFEKGASEVAGD